MRRLLWLLLALLLSPEFLVAVLLFGFYFFFSSILSELGHHLVSDKEVWKYLPALPTALAAYAFSMSFKIRSPSKGELNKLLYEWPLYQLLIDRVYVGIFYAIACFALSLLLWISGGSQDNAIVALLFLEAVAVSGISALTMHEAAQRLPEILVKYGQL